MSNTSQPKFQLSARKKAILDALLRQEGLSSAEDKIPRRQESGPAPLSFAQQRLWFFDQFEPASFAYNLLTAVSLSGAFDVTALQKAFDEIVRRHESLRTTFDFRDGQPVQIIHDHHSIPLRHIGTMHLPEGEQRQQVQDLLCEQALQPFDLRKGPLLRASLVQQATDRHVLVMAMHHIVSDAWSMNVLVSEITMFYRAFAGGSVPDLPPLPVQYADFAVWQRNWLQGEVLAQQLEYWKTQLGTAPAMLELPADRPRPAVQTYNGADFTFGFSPALSQSLKALCRKEDATLYMVLLACFKILLHRYTGQQEIIVGSPIANRQRKELEGLIGFFINTLAVRTTIVGDLSFREYLERVREAALGAYAHQDLPFEYLVEQFHPERNLSHSPLVQVIFSFEAAPMQPREIPGLEVTILDKENKAAKFDLSLYASDRGPEIVGTFEYNVDLFNKETVERMAGHLLTILAAAVSNPAQRISEFPLLTRHERYEILTTWNATDAPYPQLLCAHQLFEAQVQRTPNEIAIIFEDQELSYSQLNARANQVARRLVAMGSRPGELIGIFMERSLEMVVAVLAIAKSGAACLPLDPAYPKERLAFMLQDSAAAIVVSQQHLASGLPGSAAQVVCLDSELTAIAEEDENDLHVAVSPENWLYVIYTSGSTGRPKGVLVPHRVLVNLVAWHQASPRQSKRTLQFASLNFDVSFEEIFSTLATGGTLVVAPQAIRMDIPLLGGYVEKHKVERFHLPGTVMQKLAEEFSSRPETLGSLREFMVGGEQLQIGRPMVDLFRHLQNCVLHNHYGPTETHIVTSFPLDGSPELWPALPPLGRPIINAALYVLDAWLQPVPIGVPGELYLGGVVLSHGYLKRPDLTAERFVPDPFTNKPGSRMYSTGDVARYLLGGNVEFLGRNDFQVKIRGIRIELGEIEVALKRHPAVREAAVVLAKESQEGRLIAYVAFQPDHASSGKQLREFLHESLPDHMLPSVFVVLEAFPLTPSGKIDRLALPAPGKEAESSEGFVAPRTDLEEVLAGIFAEVLQVERVGILDDFFILGGHSLLATQISSRVREALHTELSVRKIFEEPTVSGLSRLMLDQESEPGRIERNAKLLLEVARAPEDEGSFSESALNEN
ncbi:MAG TPA: amino acid adenylation domain-containing protein [Candidatus Angelobacter sp.]